MAMPKRNRKGQFIKGGGRARKRNTNPPKRKEAPRSRRSAPTAIIRVAAPRRNPAAATVVNPYGFMQPPAVVNPRRKRRNPAGGAIIPRKLKDLTKGKVLVPLFVGGGIGVASMALVDKYIGPKVPPWALSLIKVVVGVLELPLLNRIVAGSGFYALGFAAGDALATWVTKFLPFGDVDDYTGLGDVDIAGDVDELAGLGGLGDDGTEDVIGDMDGELNVVDGYGILPPVPIPPGFPRPMLARLKRGKLMWLLRLGIRPEDLQSLLSAPPQMRRAAIEKLRGEYDSRRQAHRPPEGRPPEWAKRPRLVAKHRRLMQIHQRGRGRVQGRGRGRGGLRGMDDAVNAAQNDRMEATAGLW